MGYKVLVICGSPHRSGCTNRALEEVCRTLNEEGVETEWIRVGAEDAHGCLACRSCRRTGRCVFDDGVNRAAELLREADGLLIGSPVHYGSPAGALLGFLDRLFYSSGSKQMKVGAAVVSCRRGGNTASFDVLNKYFTISGMPVASSTYWNQVHGFTAEDVEKDLEGLQTMRNLGRNMAFLIKAIAARKEQEGLPLTETASFTSFPDGK
jgi:multimeric flavodoxin WrbA